MEQVKADCMKQKGFKYVAYVAPQRPEPDLSTYEAMKTYRQKYGFGVFSQYVYPKDPLTGSIESAESARKDDPNEQIVAKLNLSQLDSYDEALKGCIVKAAKEVLNKEVESALDGITQMREAREELEAAEIDGDPALISLAAGFADCLGGKGRRVPSTKPMALGKRGETEFWDQLEKLSGKPENQIPHRPGRTSIRRSRRRWRTWSAARSSTPATPRSTPRSVPACGGSTVRCSDSDPPLVLVSGLRLRLLIRLTSTYQ
ncbi:hypothetical protein [Nonomuraea aurantiaca]|uniref:hypothetical protein n=1 Tax=Nonomuraea aurantiaca TaxID=2878562 RepID=UPI001CDA30A2|nr:hypothetical protein [Nonomuraea aurantiaca]